ncbi:MAG: hypothetical protein LBD59_11650 [Prevotellaceae bacterium]|jgi:hypothetical protein|nr:hypothetical protein [Prevotellaceae bacterium]
MKSCGSIKIKDRKKAGCYRKTGSKLVDFGNFCGRVAAQTPAPDAAVFLPFCMKKIFLRWEENFSAVGRKLSCGGKKTFLRWEENFPAVGNFIDDMNNITKEI